MITFLQLQNKPPKRYFLHLKITVFRSLFIRHVALISVRGAREKLSKKITQQQIFRKFLKIYIKFAQKFKNIYKIVLKIFSKI